MEATRVAPLRLGGNPSSAHMSSLSQPPSCAHTSTCGRHLLERHAEPRQEARGHGDQRETRTHRNGTLTAFVKFDVAVPPGSESRCQAWKFQV
jgi:hypothetical protein